MPIMPIDKMWERVDIARQDSDTALFMALLYCGEMVAKMAVAGMVAIIDDDRERHKYRQTHRLVRADGLGDWSSVLDDVLVGPASQYINQVAREEQRDFTSKNPSGTWQHECVGLMHSCVLAVDSNLDKLPSRTDARSWVALLAALRNKTRAHGATTLDACGRLCGPVEESIRLFVDNLLLFKRPWAYLYRNLSGKYRVIKYSQPASEFDDLKSAPPANSLEDGVYIHLSVPVRVELMYSTVDALDFSFPNGSFNEKTFETISYITDTRKRMDGTPYLAPATPLPASETQGIGSLEVQGNCFGNLPPTQAGYIHRRNLEDELTTALMDDYHPIITLQGRGGIGKTWLALSTLHKLTSEYRFAVVLWFSARDIDLHPQGAKQVKPHVLTAKDIAMEFSRLVDSPATKRSATEATDYLSAMMTSSTLGPILFVFDNFETVQSPLELFGWIDTYTRSPNKVLITTRMREFKGDYLIEVAGMDERESEELIGTTSRYLGIAQLITDEYAKDIYQESMGHPYVMKVLLGEVAKAGRRVKVERIAATIDGILDALFERTYARLSPTAKRIFLTLCSWRSAVPVLALEAVLLRPCNERMDVEGAVEELRRSSFVEMSASARDEQSFLTLPLVAAVFGKRKLATSPMKSAIEADVQELLAFGAAQQSDIKFGVSPRIERLFRNAAIRVSAGKESIENYLPMLEFIAGKFPPAWLLIAKLYRESGHQQAADKAKEAIRRYIESTESRSADHEAAWGELVDLCRLSGDQAGEVHALTEMCQLPMISFRTVSGAIDRVNQLFSDRSFTVDTEEKRIVSRKLAEVMEDRIGEGDATDCSRLAWLFLRLDRKDEAVTIVQRGLSMDPRNRHCRNLATALCIDI